MFTPRVLQENGSYLPDINAFSNFADLVSDMPGKGKVLKNKQTRFSVKQRLCLRLLKTLLHPVKQREITANDCSYRIIVFFFFFLL